MKRIIFSTIIFLTCSLQAVAPMQQEIVAQLSKSIHGANLPKFETTFKTHTITAQEKQELGNLARVTRAKLQAEFDAMGKNTGNAVTFLTGLGQGVVGLWALANLTLTGLIAAWVRRSVIPDAMPFPRAFLLPAVRLPFCFTQGTCSPSANGRNVRLEFEPGIYDQLFRLWSGCAVTALPFSALTAYAFYKAGVNVARGLNYKNYLQSQIDNLEVIIEYLNQ